MTLRIERQADGRKTIIRLTGRLQSEHLEELTAQLQGDGRQIAFNLEGVTLVDVEVVRFLNQCEANGIEMIHGSPYIREWMAREKAEKNKTPQFC
jgi:anti-anti-sigma regulatory factor